MLFHYVRIKFSNVAQYKPRPIKDNFNMTKINFALLISATVCHLQEVSVFSNEVTRNYAKPY